MCPQILRIRKLVSIEIHLLYTLTWYMYIISNENYFVKGGFQQWRLQSLTSSGEHEGPGPSQATGISRKQVPSCLSDAAKHARFGELAGLKPRKTAPFVGCMRFSTSSKNAYTPLQSGWRHTANEQAVAYLRENMEATFEGVGDGVTVPNTLSNPRRYAACMHVLAVAKSYVVQHKTLRQPCFDMTLDLTEFLPNATIHVIQYRECLESQGVQMPPGLLCVKSGIPKRKRCQHV
jgi:hypothetical protein